MAKKPAPKVSEEKPKSESSAPPTPGKSKSTDANNLVLDLYTGTSEKSFEESSYWADSQVKPYNPDDLVRKTNDYSIYEEMMDDDQVDACLQIKRDLIIGSGWDITPEEEDSQSEEIQRDLQMALGEDPDVPLDDMMEEIILAHSYGFSLSEKIFKYRDDNTLTLKCIKTRHPSSWEIHTDAHGNIEKYVQHGPKGDIEVDQKSLIHYVNNRRFGNPYGRSDLRSAYAAYFVKRQVIKWYAIYLEKAASPTPVAKFDTNAPQTAIDAIHQAIKSLQTKTALTIPKEIEVEFLESKTNGEAYVKAINIFNMFIGRALLIPDLLGFQGSETSGGSYALGKDQIGILFKHIQRRRTTLERMINKHIVLPITVTNWGFIEKGPKFKLRPINEEHLLELAKTWLECVKGKTYKPSDEEINHFRSIVRFPQGEVERVDQQQFDEEGNPLPPQAGVNGGPGKLPGKPNGDKSGAKGGDDKAVKAGADKEKEKGNKAFTAKHYKKLTGDYDKKVDYEAIKSSMDRFKGRVSDEALPIVQIIFEDLYRQIKEKKIIQNQDAGRMEAIKLKSPRELNLLIKRSLREGFKEGQATGRRELLKGVFRAPLPDDAFLEFLDQETFQYIGDWSYNITKNARIRILEAIRDGKPLSTVIDILDTQGQAEAMVSIERFARTKFTDVMNRGRLASFNESGVVAAYQYSAILDDRSSEICAGLHGKIFKSGTEPIPPMHFNCRSLLVPITKYEEFEADDEIAGQAINEFIDENKGDGFAKR